MYPTLRALALVGLLGGILLSASTPASWLSAQPEGNKKVREEEEEAPKSRPQVPLVVEEGKAKQKAPANDPGAFVNLDQEAAKATQPLVKEFFRSLAIPYDLLITSQGVHYRIGLIAARELPVDELEYLELNAKLSGGTTKKIAAAGIGKIVPFEEVALGEVEKFLKRKTIEGVPRTEVLEDAAKALTAVARFHDAAREQKKRVGKGWEAFPAQFKAKLLAVRREQLQAFIDARQWQQADTLGQHLLATWPDSVDVQKDVYRLQLMRAEQTLVEGGESELLQLRDALLQYERVLGGRDALTTEVRKRLRQKADDFVNQARDLMARNQSGPALSRLRSAELIDPEAAGIRDLRTRLRDRVLYVGVPRLPEYLSPATARSDSEQWAVELMFESLLRALPDAELGTIYRPELAEALPELVPMGREFRLRRNIRWSGAGNGDLLDARDVRGTLTMLTDPKHAATWAADGLDVFDEKGIRLDDPFKLRLPFKQGVLEPLGRMTFKVQPAEYLRRNNRDIDDEDFAHNPFGSGPYRYEGRENEGEGRECAIFRANPYYGQRPGRVGLPLVREIRFYVPKPSAIAADFRAGQLHLLLDAPTAEYLRCRADPSLNAITRAGTATTNRHIQLLAINHRRPYLQAAEVRRGLSLAINREAIVKNVFRGDSEFHRALTGPFPPTCWATPAKSPELFKPDVARALVTDWANQHQALQLSLKFRDDDPRAADACRQIKEDIEKAAGPSVAIVLQPLNPEVLRKKVEAEHDYELAYCSFDYRDDLYRLDGLLDPAAAGRNGRNFLGYLVEGTNQTDRDRRLRQTVLEMRAHRDFAKQVREKTWELHSLFNQQVPFIPLWQLDRHVVVANNLDVFLDESAPQPATPAQIDPSTVFTGVERWRLK
jgi:peptide/nickel transport system substrate-binding protein